MPYPTLRQMAPRRRAPEEYDELSRRIGQQANLGVAPAAAASAPFGLPPNPLMQAINRIGQGPAEPTFADQVAQYAEYPPGGVTIEGMARPRRRPATKRTKKGTVAKARPRVSAAAEMERRRAATSALDLNAPFSPATQGYWDPEAVGQRPYAPTQEAGPYAGLPAVNQPVAQQQVPASPWQQFQEATQRNRPGYGPQMSDEELGLRTPLGAAGYGQRREAYEVAAGQPRGGRLPWQPFLEIPGGGEAVARAEAGRGEAARTSLARQLMRQGTPPATMGPEERVDWAGQRPLTPGMAGSMPQGMTAEGLAGEHAYSPGGGMSFHDWTRARIQQRTDAMAGVVPNVVGGWRGSSGRRREPSTWENLVTRAGDQDIEAQGIVERGRRRMREQQTTGLPMATRRELVTGKARAKRYGEQIPTVPQAEYRQMVRAGGEPTLGQTMAAYGPAGTEFMSNEARLEAERQGTFATALSQAQTPEAVRAIRGMYQNLPGTTLPSDVDPQAIKYDLGPGDTPKLARAFIATLRKQHPEMAMDAISELVREHYPDSADKALRVKTPGWFDRPASTYGTPMFAVPVSPRAPH